jgi:hypothetical protein
MLRPSEEVQSSSVHSRYCSDYKYFQSSSVRSRYCPDHKHVQPSSVYSRYCSDHKYFQSSSVRSRYCSDHKHVQSSSVHSRYCSDHKYFQSSSVSMLRYCSLTFTSLSDRPNIAVQRRLASMFCVKYLPLSKLEYMGQLLGYLTTVF